MFRILNTLGTHYRRIVKAPQNIELNRKKRQPQFLHSYDSEYNAVLLFRIYPPSLIQFYFGDKRYLFRANHKR